MSLHRPGDVVRMMDKGIVVQPGLRTLFELHYSQVEFTWPLAVRGKHLFETLLLQPHGGYLLTSNFSKIVLHLSKIGPSFCDVMCSLTYLRIIISCLE